MVLQESQRNKIVTLLRTKLNEKLARYERETTVMPFLSLLVQNEEMVVSFSFILSLLTTLGQSIYEQVAEIIAAPMAAKVGTRVKIGGTISPARKAVIDSILNDLRRGNRTANKLQEIKEILSASKEGGVFQKEGNIADFFMQRNNMEYYFEIKTVKPNIDVVTTTKRKLLEWVARKDKFVKTIVAFPYNPYEPEPYERFTEQGLLDKKEEVMVGREFWDFLGGSGTYSDLLKVFDSVGKEFKHHIDEKIKEVAKRKFKV